MPLHMNFNSGIRATGFICWKLTYMFWKKFQNQILSWYIRCIDESLNQKFNFGSNFRIYSWYVKACIDINFDLERFLVHVHMICKCIHKSKILYNIIYDSYMRYVITYLDHKIYILYDPWLVYEIYEIMYWSEFYLDLNFTYIYDIYICMLNLKIIFMI